LLYHAIVRESPRYLEIPNPTFGNGMSKESFFSYPYRKGKGKEKVRGSGSQSSHLPPPGVTASPSGLKQ
jgi:hypothetical protein